MIFLCIYMAIDTYKRNIPSPLKIPWSELLINHIFAGSKNRQRVSHCSLLGFFYSPMSHHYYIQREIYNPPSLSQVQPPKSQKPKAKINHSPPLYSKPPSIDNNIMPRPASQTPKNSNAWGMCTAQPALSRPMLPNLLYTS